MLLVILFVPKTEFIGLPGTAIMPFAAVTTVLVMQWASTLIIPILERRLIYTDDQDQAQKIEEFSNRLLTETDARQLLEATLAAICDYLRVSSAFIVSLKPDGAHLEQVVGSVPPAQSWLDSPDFSAMATDTTPIPDSMRVWQSFWLVPLRSTRLNGATDGGGRQIGMMGVWARAVQPDLTHDEMTLFKALHTRAARVLDDMLLEEEIFNLVEDVLGRLPNDRVNAKELALGDKSKITLDDSTKALIESPEFLDSVRLALKDLWGGVGLTDSPLIKLRIVVRALPENENNASRALRAVILQAFENLKPEGQRSLTAASWAIYNILEFRFKDGKKVRETANRLAMSEPDLYRKQRYAIEQVAAQIKEMEQRELNSAVH